MIKTVRINNRAAKKLKDYEWPGNIRELENVLYRALKRMILDGVNILNPNHIENLGKTGAILEDRKKRRKTLTVENIKQALKNNNNVKTHAANELGYSREHFSRFYKKMSENGKL